jgi:hypothetical protein
MVTTLVTTLGLAVSTQLARLNWIDILVIAIYFAIVVFIGFYLRGSSNTSEEFFMAGREMTDLPTSMESWPCTGTGSGQFRRCSSWALS